MGETKSTPYCQCAYCQIRRKVNSNGTNSFNEIKDALRAFKLSLGIDYPSGTPESFDSFQKAREWNAAFSNNLSKQIELAELREKAHVRQVNNVCLWMLAFLYACIIGIVLSIVC